MIQQFLQRCVHVLVRACRLSFLWACVFIYIFIGGVSLAELEEEDERKRAYTYCSNKTALDDFYKTEASAYEKIEYTILQTGHQIEGNYTADANWDLKGSCFFAFTTIATIGYGNYVPFTPKGKFFTMFYAIGGIMLFGMATSETSTHLDNLLSAQFGGRHQTFHWAAIITLWLLLSGSYYSSAEGWRFWDGVYFSYISTATIGFGDFSPIKTRDQPMNYCLIGGGLVIMNGFLRSLYNLLGAKETVSQTLGGEDTETSGLHGVHVEKDLRDKLALPLKVIGGIVQHLPLVLLWLLVFLYMLFGGAVFRYIELQGGKLDAAAFKGAWQSIQPGGEAEAALTASLTGVSNSTVAVSNSTQAEAKGMIDTLLGVISQTGTCPIPKTIGGDQATDEESQWGYLNAGIFAMTVFTTIGYGTVVPRTVWGKIFCVPYSLVGFWLFGVAQARSATNLTKLLDSDGDNDLSCNWAHKLKCRCKCLLGTATSVFSLTLAVGVCMIILLTSAVLFTATEGWTFLIAVWFSFSSMATIGYGDYTPLFNGPNFVVELLSLSVGLTSMALAMYFVALNADRAANCLGISGEARDSTNPQNEAESKTKTDSEPKKAQAQLSTGLERSNKKMVI